MTTLNDLTDVTIATPENNQRLVYEDGVWVNKTVAPAEAEWVRDPSWLAISEIDETDQKFVGLIAVFPDSNFTAFTAAAAYEVDWGDGSALDTYSSGATALKEFDYNAAALVGTDAPVTLTDTGDLVERTAHGYSNGNTVTLWNVTGSTGPVSGQVYYVINATANAFQIATTPEGSAVTITTDGTATLLPYRQAIVTVTPQSGQDLTELNLNIRHTQAGLQAYETGWLDIEIGSPNFTASGMVIRTAAQTVRMGMVERIRIANLGGQTTCANMFQNCIGLQSVPLFDTAAVANMSSMFSNCSSLQSVPLFNTAAVTSMFGMVQNCSSLQSVPLFNTAAVTTMQAMFSNCNSLQSVPLFDTAAVTNMSTMFSGCTTLQSVPALTTSAVTISGSLTSIFASCISLARIEAKEFKATFSVANCKLSAPRLEEVFTNLARPATGQTITITGNFGAVVVSRSGYGTTSGSTTVTQTDTTGLVAGQEVSGPGVSDAVAVTFQDTGDTVTRTAHGIADGTPVSFATIVTTTGITTYTTYFVVNATADTFQVADTAGGSPRALTTDGSGTLLYGTTIVSIVPNTSIELSIPASATGSVTLVAGEAKRSIARLKNWTVTG